MKAMPEEHEDYIFLKYQSMGKENKNVFPSKIIKNPLFCAQSACKACDLPSVLVSCSVLTASKLSMACSK